MDGEVEEKEGCGRPPFGGQDSEVTEPVRWPTEQEDAISRAVGRRGSWGSTSFEAVRLDSTPTPGWPSERGERRRSRRTLTYVDQVQSVLLAFPALLQNQGIQCFLSRGDADWDPLSPSAKTLSVRSVFANGVLLLEAHLCKGTPLM